jgi:hypothetical protein
MKELNSRDKIQRYMAVDGLLLWSTAVTSPPQGHSFFFLRQNQQVDFTVAKRGVGYFYLSQSHPIFSL